MDTYTDEQNYQTLWVKEKQRDCFDPSVVSF